MTEVLALTQALMARASITPDDAGCQPMLAARLQAAGFTCEHMRFGEVDNLWATHGSGALPLGSLGEPLAPSRFKVRP